MFPYFPRRMASGYDYIKLLIIKPLGLNFISTEYRL